jgi:diaminohydroxyphosphoribosylaminopyrimidine deaminase/5-amino-6-(5-phosphoribosylamino)uracil reductase
MKRCLDLAKLGLGNVAPNPMVGCVIVFEGKIIGEGFHQIFGSHHAEVNAIESVKDKSLLKKCTLYVNLEPCVHFGKTPPCTDLIIKHQIPHVIIGAIDDHDVVAGKGLEHLKQQGVHVEVDILKEDCIALNKRFYTAHNKKRPYIFLKWAETEDGFISKINMTDEVLENNWITGAESKTFIHQMRASEQAILIGKNTVIADNPALTTRLVDGNSPLRIVLCNSTEGLKSQQLITDENPTLIFNTEINNILGNKEFIKFDGSIKEVLQTLVKRGIQSIIIEGGSNVINQFIQLGLWDEALQLIGAKKFNKGILAPVIKDFKLIDTFKSGKDIVNHYNKCI